MGNDNKIEYVYRSAADLQALGERVRDTAIRVTLTHAEQYGYAQQRAVNQAHQANQASPEYAPPEVGRPDDDARLRAFVNAEFDGIPAMFTAFAIPDPNEAQPMVDALLRTAATLQPSLQLKVESNLLYDGFYVGDYKLDFPVGTLADTVLVRMKNWHGNAADNFEAYIQRFGLSTLFQRQLAVALAFTLQAELEIKRRMLVDVWTLGEKTIDVLDALDHFHCPTRGGAALTITVVGAIAAIALAAIVTEGQILPVLAAGAEAVQGIGAVLSTSGPFTVEQPLGGVTVPDVIGSMQAAMNRIVSLVDQKQQELAGDVRTLGQQVHELRRTIQLDPPFDDGLSNATVADLDDTGKGLFYDR